jgi:hypothetical protein
MENNNNIEVILLSKPSITNAYQAELLKWLTTIVQSVIAKQHETTKKSFLKILRDTPGIFLS